MMCGIRRDFPAARIESKDCAFAPYFFMLGCEFVSARLRAILSPFTGQTCFVDVDASDSSDAFRAQDYSIAIPPSLSPFEQVFIDAVMEAGPHVNPVFRVREGFRPAEPIFHVARRTKFPSRADDVQPRD